MLQPGCRQGPGPLPALSVQLRMTRSMASWASAPRLSAGGLWLLQTREEQLCPTGLGPDRSPRLHAAGQQAVIGHPQL